MISFVSGACLKEETCKFVLKHDIKSFGQESQNYLFCNVFTTKPFFSLNPDLFCR